MKFLSKYEEILLLAIWKLKDDAYGAKIKRLVSTETGKEWNYGNLYCILDQLVKKRYVIKTTGEPTAERGGRSKNYYHLTKDGLVTLQEAKDLNTTLWNEVPDTIFKHQ